jgi:ferric iron reductase protein FhuF
VAVKPVRAGGRTYEDVTADLLKAVATAAPFLRGRVARSPAGAADGTGGGPNEVAVLAGELACARLARDPAAVAAAVASGAQARGSEDAVVLASLWWQGYAYRIAGTALACWLLTGRAPDVRAEAMAVGIARGGRPSSVTFVRPAEPCAGLERFHDRLFAGHLDRVATALRSRHRLGRQLAWGNVAAACASAAGAVRHAAGAGWAEQVEAFLATAPHDLASLGEWSRDSGAEAAVHGDAGTDAHHPADAEAAWSYRRLTCCLWWKTSTSGGALCRDCSLRRGEPRELGSAAT